MAFPETLKELRNKYSITQSKLADLLGVTQSSIALYESGKNQPTSPILKSLSRIFDVSTDFLLGQSSVPNIKSIDSETLTLPVYDEFISIKESVAIESFSISSSEYDFILAPDKLIAFSIDNCEYIPFFYPRDTLIVELQNFTYYLDKYYLALDSLGHNLILQVKESERDVYLSQMLNYHSHSLFTPEEIQNNLTILGKIIGVHRIF